MKFTLMAALFVSAVNGVATDITGALSSVYSEASLYSSYVSSLSSSAARRGRQYSVDSAQSYFTSLTNFISSAETFILNDPTGATLNLATSNELNNIHALIAYIMGIYVNTAYTNDAYNNIFNLYYPVITLLDFYVSAATYDCPELATLSSDINLMSLSFSAVRTRYADIQEFPFETPTCTTRSSSSSSSFSSTSSSSSSSTTSASIITLTPPIVTITPTLVSTSNSSSVASATNTTTSTNPTSSVSTNTSVSAAATNTLSSITSTVSNSSSIVTSVTSTSNSTTVTNSTSGAGSVAAANATTSASITISDSNSSSVANSTMNTSTGFTNTTTSSTETSTGASSGSGSGQVAPVNTATGRIYTTVTLPGFTTARCYLKVTSSSSADRTTVTLY